MNINFAVYQKKTGKIITLNYGDKSDIEYYKDETTDAMEGNYHGYTHIINGMPVIIPIETPVITKEKLIILLRNQRNQLLSSCDWTQVSDAPLTPEKKIEWVVYRQKLRDFITNCDINNPVWPTPPSK